MEELKLNGFDKTYCLTLVKDKNFYCGNKTDGIYAFFRAGRTVNGRIEKPTGEKSESINLSKEYFVSWEQCNNLKYYIIEI